MEHQILLEKLEPAQSKRAVVIVGRFQPPTIGHYLLINQAKKYIRENNHLDLFTKPIVVVVDGTVSGQDKKKNPLSAEDRIYFMQHSGKANGVIFLVAKNAFDAFNQVRKAGYEPIVVGAGSDRVDGYLDMLNDKFVDNSGKKQKHYQLSGVESRNELKASKESLDRIKDGQVNVSKVSGSLARRAVELDYFDEFVSITGLDKNIPAAKKMFRQIKKAFGEQ